MSERYWRHMALLFMGLFASEGLDCMYRNWLSHANLRLRRRAPWARAKSVVRLDRILNNEGRALEGWNV